MARNGCYINLGNLLQKTRTFNLIQDYPGFGHFTSYVRIKLHGFHILVFSFFKAPHFPHKKTVIVVKRGIIRVVIVQRTGSHSRFCLGTARVPANRYRIGALSENQSGDPRDRALYSLAPVSTTSEPPEIIIGVSLPHNRQWRSFVLILV